MVNRGLNRDSVTGALSVTDVSDKTSNTKCSRFRGGGGAGIFINVRNTHVCYMKVDIAISTKFYKI